MDWNKYLRYLLPWKPTCCHDNNNVNQYGGNNKGNNKGNNNYQNNNFNQWSGGNKYKGKSASCVIFIDCARNRIKQ